VVGDEEEGVRNKLITRLQSPNKSEEVMVDVKMTNILVSTSQFLATVAYPVKIKVAAPISKKVVAFHESLNAVIEVTPIVHGSHDTPDLAETFYNVLSQDTPVVFTKNKKRELGDFLEMCGEKIRAQIAESAGLVALELLGNEVNHVIVNLIDKSGNLIHSRTRSLDDIVASLRHIKTKILLWRTPKKRSSLPEQPEEKHAPRIHHKERFKGEKEGGMRRYLEYSRKIA
jgi:hypothetical protein